MNTFRAIRKQLNLTQASLAESLGVTQGNVAHYEGGQTVPPDVARRLIERAKELGHEITFDDVYAADKKAAPDIPATLPYATPNGAKAREAAGGSRQPLDPTKEMT